MNEFELLVSVFVAGMVAGVVAWHFGHAVVAKKLALAEAELVWIKGVPGSAVADVEAILSKIIAPVTGAVSRIESAVAPAAPAAPAVPAAPAAPAAPHA